MTYPQILPNDAHCEHWIGYYILLSTARKVTLTLT